MQVQSKRSYATPSIFVYLGALAVDRARMNLAQIVIQSEILLPSSLIGGLNLRRAHFP